MAIAGAVEHAAPARLGALLPLLRAASALLLAGAALLLAGCASCYSGFRLESEIPECEGWLREAGEFPPTVRLLPAGTAGGRVLRVSVEERGTGERDRLLVLVHGVLSDRRLWRFMEGRLARTADVASLDLPGCGRSDAPPESALGPAGYSPDFLARATLEALRGILRGRGPGTRVTLVGHSLGTGVILRALGSREILREYADVVRRVDGAVLFAPIEFSYAKRDPVFEKVSTLGGLEVRVGNALGLLRAEVAEAIRAGAGDPETTPREEVDRVHEILSDAGRRAAAQSMLRNAIPFTEDLRPDWDRIGERVADYGRVAVPVILATGARDDSVPEALAFKLRQQLPRAWLRVFPRTGHSLPTERPEECARLVLDFADSGAVDWTEYAETPAGPPERGPVAAVRASAAR